MYFHPIKEDETMTKQILLKNFLKIKIKRNVEMIVFEKELVKNFI